MQLIKSINEDKNGIEIRFDEKPMDELTALLGKMGFKYSYKQTMWYANQTDQRIDFIERLTLAVETELDLETIELYPAYEASLENIDNRNYSYVLVEYQSENDQSIQTGHLIFEPCKRIAEEIVKRFATSRFGEQLKKITVFPRNYKKRARSLFEEGKVIYSSIPKQKEQPHEELKLIEEMPINQFTTQVVDLANDISTLTTAVSPSEDDSLMDSETPAAPEALEEQEEGNRSLPQEVLNQDPTTLQDENILEELFQMNRVNQLGRSFLKEVGLKTPLNAWEITIGKYQLIRTTVFSFTYRLIKLPA